MGVSLDGGAEGLINESTNACLPSGPKATPKGVRRPNAKWVSTWPSIGAGATAVEQATIAPTGDAVGEVEAGDVAALKVIRAATTVVPTAPPSTYR
jgi:hypothetical protein